MKTKKTKPKIKAIFREPDEYWFGDGYWSIHIGNEELVTSSQKLALKIARLLNQKRKAKK